MKLRKCVMMYDIFCFKQKTAYEMRISDWSSDVCSSDLILLDHLANLRLPIFKATKKFFNEHGIIWQLMLPLQPFKGKRSEEHTSELQSLMRISYAVFCLKKKTKHKLTQKKILHITTNRKVETTIIKHKTIFN